jgi:ribosomal protein S14
MKINFLNKSVTLDFLKRKKIVKKELKLLILKSIIRNRNIPYIKRLQSVILYEKQINKYKAKFLSKQLNVCVITGKKKTTFQLTNMSRHMTKKFSDFGLIQNVKRIN